MDYPCNLGVGWDGNWIEGVSYYKGFVMAGDGSWGGGQTTS